ncbi:MAG TPA: SCO6880 family protein, partial [Acidimicrobiales bacterium]|nr:SCO6880 family protein [Acidimicrobiales bacterium]
QPELGFTLPVRESSKGRTEPLRNVPPKLLAGVSIGETCLPGVGAIGVISDSRHGTHCSVLAVAGEGFSLCEREEQADRIGLWSALLAGLARDRSPVDRLQWICRSVPQSPAAYQSNFESGCSLDRNHTAARSYESLIADELAYSVRHETYLVLRLNERKAKGASSLWSLARSGSADRAQESAMFQLGEEVAELSRQLESSGIKVQGVLDGASIAQVVGESFLADPDTGTRSSPWPMGISSDWSSVVTDSVSHAVYWIAEWPRVEVGPDFLAPILLNPSARITVSTVMEPISALAAARKVENARVSRAADDELRRRGGFAVTARRNREGESLQSRELELADGHAQYRFSGYAAVSAEGPDELDRACGALEQAASRCFLSLRRLYGDQQRALTWILPLGEGLS